MVYSQGNVSAAQSPTDEDAIDLDDLDAHGVEGVVEAARGGGGSGRGRPVWISLVVLVLAIPLLVRMYPDFRYWLRSSTPVDLGHASELVQGGHVRPGHHDAYVVLRGTPDVRNVALGRTKTEHVRYMRLMESEGDLFAVVRTPKEASDALSKTVTYPGVFEGRLVRLGDLGRTRWNLFERESAQYRWLERFYELENVTRTIDGNVDAFVAALERGGGIVIEGEAGTLALGPDDRLRIVVERPEARVLIGSALLDAERARAQVAALGVPFAVIESPAPTRPREPAGVRHSLPQAQPHRFAVRIPKAERDAVAARLRGAIASELAPDPDDTTAAPREPLAPEVLASADPHKAVSVLPMTATFTVAPGELSLEHGKLRVPFVDGASTGYDVVDGALREREVTEGSILIDPAEIVAVRVERPVRIDPEGYAIVHGETPEDAGLVAALWLFTLVVALGNGALVATRLLGPRP